MGMIVVEADGRRAVAVSRSGDFVRILNRNYTVGQQLEDRAAARPRMALRTLAAAVAAAAIMIAGGGYAYCAPYTQVSLDVNPSIELKLNIFNRVIGADALNDDAEGILSQLHLLNRTFAGATEQIVEELAHQGYIGPDQQAYVMITTQSRDQTRSQDMLQNAIRTVEQKTTQLRIHATVRGECVGEELLIRAREYGVSPGKLLLAEQYANSTGDAGQVNLQEWLNKPVREIVSGIRANGETPAGENNAFGYTGGEDHGIGYGGGDPDDSGTDSAAVTAAPQTNGQAEHNGYTGGEDHGAGPQASPAPSLEPSPVPSSEPSPTAAITPKQAQAGSQSPCPSPTCTGDEVKTRNEARGS